MGSNARKEVLDVSSMQELLVFAKRARRRRRLILMIKFVLAAALALGLAYGGRELFLRFRA